MSKVNKLKEKFGSQIRESVAGGTGSPNSVIEHPSRNLKYEGSKRAFGFRNIELNLIEADKQHREEFNKEELQSLAESMKSTGLIAPLVVRWDQARKKYILIAGERRFRAAKICGWSEVKCDVKPDEITKGEVAEIQLAENHSRKNLNPIELAKAFSDVIAKNGYTARDLAKRLGINETTVSRYLRMLVLPDDIQAEISRKKISIAIAREAARLKTEPEQRRFIKEALSKNASTVESQQLATRTKTRSKRSRGVPSLSAATRFKTEFGTVSVSLSKQAKNPTFHHVEEALKQAMDEVELRIKSGIRL